MQLYARYLSPAQIQQLKNAFKEQSINVETNTLAFPKGVDRSTIIYSPMIKDRQAVDKIQTTAETLNWPISSTNPLVAQNHWVTKNSVALLLLPEGIYPDKKSSPQDIAATYKSDNCASKVSIELKADYQYEMHFQSENILDKALETGYWQIRSYPYIELYSVDKFWWFYFKIEQSIEADNVSSFELTTLVPQDNYRVFPQCSFVDGTRI